MAASEVCMQPVEVKSFLESRLAGTQVEVQGQGCDFQLNLISDELAGMSPVKRQQLVYSTINAQVTSDAIHAISMQTYTPAEWDKKQKSGF